MTDFEFRVGAITISDRASLGVYEDRSGPEIVRFLNDALATPFALERRLVADEVEHIAQAIADLVDRAGCQLVVTTGGTGPALRDVTLEACRSVWHREMPGFGEQMRRVSLQSVPTAILSRQEAGIRFAPSGVGSLIITLPGSPKAIRECLFAVFEAVPYCIELCGGPIVETRPEVVKAFRPKKQQGG
jgi:molybdopterin adenylyltransferase